MAPDNDYQTNDRRLLTPKAPGILEQFQVGELWGEEISSVLDVSRLSQVFNALPGSLMIADAAGTVRYINPGFTRLTGYVAEEVVGRPVNGLNSGDDHEDAHAHIASVLESGLPWSGECRKRTKGGEHYWTITNMVAIRDRIGAVTDVLIAEEDISERKLLLAQLRQAQRMESMGYLVAGVTHDFNNLLQAMLGFVNLLQAQLDSSTEAYGYSKTVETLAQKGVDLAKQLLSARPAEGLVSKPADLNLAILEVLQILAPGFSEAIRVDTRLQDDLPQILGDFGQLQQAIANLCLNAADAMPDGGQLGLSTGLCELDEEIDRDCKPPNGGYYVCLTVSDTGVGISEGDQEKIFAPFFTTKEADRGTGIGLSLVQKIVKHHGGLVQVRSELGDGSRFLLYFPVPSSKPNASTSTD